MRHKGEQGNKEKELEIIEGERRAKREGEKVGKARKESRYRRKEEEWRVERVRRSEAESKEKKGIEKKRQRQWR